MTLPGPTKVPCNECPWRKASTPGHLGPASASVWADAIHGEGEIACHKTIPSGYDSTRDEEWPDGMLQCRGAGQMRTNVFKSPRNPDIWTADSVDTTVVFESTEDFKEHHNGLPPDMSIFDWHQQGWINLRALRALARAGVTNVHQAWSLAHPPQLFSRGLQDLEGIGLQTEYHIIDALDHWKRGDKP